MPNRSLYGVNSPPRCQKSYHRDNWLVAAKRSKRRCFLILRCRLFLALGCSLPKASDCSPAGRRRGNGGNGHYRADRHRCGSGGNAATGAATTGADRHRRGNGRYRTAQKHKTHKNAKTQKRKNTKTQNTKTQKHKNTKTQNTKTART